MPRINPVPPAKVSPPKGYIYHGQGALLRRVSLPYILKPTPPNGSTKVKTLQINHVGLPHPRHVVVRYDLVQWHTKLSS